VAAFVNRGFPAGPVLVLTGKLPTTPRTGAKVKTMGTGQLRYWSMCQNESLFTTKGAGCAYDAQIPVDRKGNYTIVTSTAGDRPKNATTKCGVAYIPWPKAGDGDGNLNDGFLLVRNMLPAPTFKQAIQNTKTPGDEARLSRVRRVWSSRAPWCSSPSMSFAIQKMLSVCSPSRS